MTEKLKKVAVILNGFLHDFAAGIWLAAIAAIALIHRMHQAQHQEIVAVLNRLEHIFFWASVVAMVVIMATGAGRTFTYVDNWYGVDAERVRRRMLIVKHVVLFSAFGAGYLVVYPLVFH
ncbi:hypothetical protein KI811_09785 [Geobacter hydrogenophilus]|uniref:Uncharacterized protein n=1 Tax=Geobacter hydrogenophilus TaxID=40983 RepID=A0A9W6G1C2_9BACT|nr:hypothetical protein [Geobacter hydrogenophilus]MBT0894098.1 hypothetical protein [Geobacter hydrogenophilus]GLI38619.1 hypothetical protein GHYDROH2_21200 [Geobacter hydrogenophilus]